MYVLRDYSYELVGKLLITLAPSGMILTKGDTVAPITTEERRRLDGNQQRST
jgi:hypothetical protein